MVYRRNLGCAHHRFAPRPCWPPTAPTLRKARALSRPRARLAWLGTASSTEVAPTACQKSFWGGGRLGGPRCVPRFQAEIPATFGRGRPQEEGWADPIAVAA